MNILAMTYLLIAAFILIISVLIGTYKIKSKEWVKKATKEQKQRGLTLLMNLWKKQMIMAGITLTLIVSTIILRDYDGTLVASILGLLSAASVFISAILTVYNYNKFKSQFRDFLIEVFK